MVLAFSFKYYKLMFEKEIMSVSQSEQFINYKKKKNS